MSRIGRMPIAIPEGVTVTIAENNKVALKVIPGHFVTSHSHINYYVDLTTLQARQNEAEAAAKLLAKMYENNTVVDTIICLNNCEIIGAYLAQELTKGGIM